MKGFFEIFSIIIGRYIFGHIGYFIRKGWFKIFKKRIKSVDDFDLSEVVDIEDFNNRLVGFLFVMGIIIIIICI